MHESIFDPGILGLVQQPIDIARGLPNTAYVSAAAFALDREKVMATTWACVGFQSDLSRPNWVRPLWFMGLPLLITRTPEDKIRVFHNVCSHRGMHVVTAPG